MKSNKPVSYIIVGAGNRGQGYAGFAAEFPERAQVLGVAEPRAFQRGRLVDQHHPEHVFLDWREAALFTDRSAAHPQQNGGSPDADRPPRETGPAAPNLGIFVVRPGPETRP